MSDDVFYDADGCRLFMIHVDGDPYPSWGRIEDCPALIAAGGSIEHCNDEIAFTERPDPEAVRIVLDFWDRQAEYLLEEISGGARAVESVVANRPENREPKGLRTRGHSVSTA